MNWCTIDTFNQVKYCKYKGVLENTDSTYSGNKYKEKGWT